MTATKILTGFLGVALALVGPIAAPAQTGQPPAPEQQADQLPAYKPPPRGAPGGRVGGASRGTYRLTVALPTIEVLAPKDHAGLSANPTPNLYFLASGPVTWPTQFTISAPNQAVPVIEASIPPPSAGGVYGLRVADYHVRLQPGVTYTWSVAAILDPNARSRDIVASASLLLGTPDPAVENAARLAPPGRRAALYAQAGFWYDAVTAAAEARPADGSAALDALVSEIGIVEPGYDRRASAGVVTAR
jgi:hypothetical protein